MDLEFVGQSSRTVKIFGRQVDLDELERTLATLPKVSHAALLAHENKLFGFLVAEGIHWKRWNPVVGEMKQSSLSIPTKDNSSSSSSSQWREEKRYVAVNSFGQGGTNVHIILSSPPIRKSEPRLDNRFILPISVPTQSAAHSLVNNCKELVSKKNQSVETLNQIAATLQMGQAFFPYRTALLMEYLPLVKYTEIPLQKAPENGPMVIFLFPGQGDISIQWYTQLYESEPIFREEFNHIIESLEDDELSSNLQNCLQLKNEAERHNVSRIINQTKFSQVFLFVVQLSLVKLWSSFGVTPAGVIGHSVGEFCAGCVTEVFNERECARLVMRRGKLMQSVQFGSMIMANTSEVYAKVLAGLLESVSVAAVNGKERVVFSGPTDQIDRLLKNLQQGGFKSQKLKTSHAFHSAMMEPILPDFEKELNQCTLQAPRPDIQFFSTCTGKIESSQLQTPTYWSSQLRQTILFRSVLEAIEPGNQDIVVLEMSAKASFKSVVPEMLPSATVFAEGLNPRNVMAELWSRGTPVDFRALYPSQSMPLLTGNAPTYPFQFLEGIQWAEDEEEEEQPQLTSNKKDPALEHPYPLVQLPPGLKKEQDSSFSMAFFTSESCKIVDLEMGVPNSKQPAEPPFQFPLGCVSRIFTLACLGIAVDYGNMTLDKTIGELLPNSYRKRLVQEVSNITIHQLASSTSGLPNFPDGLVRDGSDISDEEFKKLSSMDTEALYQNLVKVQLLYLSGTKCSYSVFGVAVLSQLISEVVGPLDKFLNKHIFRPLNICHTGSQPEHPAILSSLRGGQADWGFCAGAFRYAAWLWSTAQDLSKFAQYLLSNHDRKFCKLVLNYMFSAGYGPANHPICWYSGGTAGSVSFFILDLEHKIGVVAVTNTALPIPPFVMFGMESLHKFATNHLDKPLSSVLFDLTIFQLPAGVISQNPDLLCCNPANNRKFNSTSSSAIP